MADANVNPLRKSCKYSTAGRKHLKQTVRKQNERLQKEARGEVLRKKRNIVEEVSPPSLNGKTGGNAGNKQSKRREELLAWKAKRDQKREAEARKRAKLGDFVVKHVNYSPPKYLIGKDPSCVQVGSRIIEAVSGRQTRSSSRLAKKKDETKKKTEKESVPKQNGKAKVGHEVRNKVPTSSTKESTEKEEEVKNEDDTLAKSVRSIEKDKGFVFPCNSNGIVPQEFNFGRKSPLVHFTSSALRFQDPIALFNESVRDEGAVRFDKQSNEDPIAKFNASMRSCDKTTEQLSPTHVLRCTPQRSAYHSKVLAEGENVKVELPLQRKPDTSTSECPAKLPMTPRAICLLQEMNSDGFTPRRIKSSRYFKDLLEKERKNFTIMNSDWTVYLEQEELTEEVKGEIRTVIGQAQLLMHQRFKQFEKLIQVHQNHQQVQGATASDLQGFWDMINYQIMDVHEKFLTLEKMKKNNWVVEVQNTRKVKPKKVVDKKRNDGKRMNTRQEETRRFKKAMRARMQKLNDENKGCGVQILTDSDHKRDAVSRSHSSTFLRNVVSQSDSKFPSSGRSSSSDEMSADSLEDERSTAKLSVELEKVKIGDSQNIDTTTSPLKEIDNLFSHQMKDVKVNDDSLFGLGFATSPKKSSQSVRSNQLDISLITFD